ncbi:uncharacterized protein BO87DRAFT_395412 [Aspergillus neoniger CBS 115656]|uniref:Uncharacterized protein n=1 Tax=Aspergillus neoniger (strain CBS 115656) TaxID=1448310 RepID=A0A318YMP3_ASPNB|nr:hypothetical protein BO87DRAFT_395412 [Aspergillus neoniger CBS 115656]PYH35905.1 hypothetical protein BO87DRAFT_395412 [Aspergillus neoniger CBS 115656]
MDRCSLFLGPPAGALERGSLVMDYYGYVRWYTSNLALKGPVSSRRLHFGKVKVSVVCSGPSSSHPRPVAPPAKSGGRSGGKAELQLKVPSPGCSKTGP